MLKITDTITIFEHEVELTAMCAQGKGGQNVNKVASAIHLRFDIRASSLPQWVKTRLLQLGDKRITKEGVVVIKAQNERSQERNREDALARLSELIKKAMVKQKPRRATKPSRGAVKRRLESKSQRSALKKSRGKVDF